MVGECKPEGPRVDRLGNLGHCPNHLDTLFKDRILKILLYGGYLLGTVEYFRYVQGYYFGLAVLIDRLHNS